MTAEIDTSDLQEGLEAMSREEAREAAGRWFSTSQEVLYEKGDEHDYDVASVAQAALPPQWDSSRDGYVFEYLHHATRFFNDGTAPHEVEAQQADFLAFEWEDAPPEIQEMFEETFPTVFFKSVEVDGIPALRFFEAGQQEAERYLEGQS